MSLMSDIDKGVDLKNALCNPTYGIVETKKSKNMIKMFSDLQAYIFEDIFNVIECVLYIRGDRGAFKHFVVVSIHINPIWFPHDFFFLCVSTLNYSKRVSHSRPGFEPTSYQKSR